MKHSTVYLRQMSWRLKVHHSFISSLYGEWVVLSKTELRNLSSPLLLPAGYPTEPYDTTSFFTSLLSLLASPALMSLPPHTENSGHYVLVESVEQSVANIQVSVCLCCQTRSSYYELLTSLHHLHILTMDWWHVSMACSVSGICYTVLQFTNI